MTKPELSFPGTRDHSRRAVPATGCRGKGTRVINLQSTEKKILNWLRTRSRTQFLGTPQSRFPSIINIINNKTHLHFKNLPPKLELHSNAL